MTGPTPWSPPPPPADVASTPPPAVRPSSAMVVFQFSLIVLFAVAGAWASIGRFFFGVGGWFGVIMVVTVFPLVALYGLALEIVVLVRYRSRGFVLQRWTAVSLMVALVGLMVAGFTIIDFGDAPDSEASLLTAALHASADGVVASISTMLAWGGLGVAAVGMIVGFILVFVEKPSTRPSVA